MWNLVASYEPEQFVLIGVVFAHGDCGNVDYKAAGSIPAAPSYVSTAPVTLSTQLPGQRRETNGTSADSALDQVDSRE